MERWIGGLGPTESEEILQSLTKVGLSMATVIYSTHLLATRRPQESVRNGKNKRKSEDGSTEGYGSAGCGHYTSSQSGKTPVSRIAHIILTILYQVLPGMVVDKVETLPDVTIATITTATVLRPPLMDGPRAVVATKVAPTLDVTIATITIATVLRPPLMDGPRAMAVVTKVTPTLDVTIAMMTPATAIRRPTLMDAPKAMAVVVMKLTPTIPLPHTGAIALVATKVPLILNVSTAMMPPSATTIKPPHMEAPGAMAMVVVDMTSLIMAGRLVPMEALRVTVLDKLGTKTKAVISLRGTKDMVGGPPMPRVTPSSSHMERVGAKTITSPSPLMVARPSDTTNRILGMEELTTRMEGMKRACRRSVDMVVKMVPLATGVIHTGRKRLRTSNQGKRGLTDGLRTIVGTVPSIIEAAGKKHQAMGVEMRARVIERNLVDMATRKDIVRAAMTKTGKLLELRGSASAMNMEEVEMTVITANTKRNGFFRVCTIIHLYILI